MNFYNLDGRYRGYKGDMVVVSMVNHLCDKPTCSIILNDEHIFCLRICISLQLCRWILYAIARRAAISTLPPICKRWLNLSHGLLRLWLRTVWIYHSNITFNELSTFIEAWTSRYIISIYNLWLWTKLKLYLVSNCIGDALWPFPWTRHMIGYK